MATIIFSASNVPEDATAGTVIGPVRVEGGAEGETFTFILNNPYFEIRESAPGSGQYNVVVKEGVEFDYETGQRTFPLTIQATSANGTEVSDHTVELALTDVNERPYIPLDDRIVSEGAMPGTVVYTLKADDPDGNVVTYELSAESDAVFDLVDNKDGSWSVVVDDAVRWLELGNNAHNRFTVEITHGGESYEDTFDLNLSENLEPEVDFQAIQVGQIVHGGTTVGMLTATDPDGHQMTYTLSDESEELFDLVKNPDGTWSVRVEAGVTLNLSKDENTTFDVAGSDGFNLVERTFSLAFANKEPQVTFTPVAVKEGEGAEGQTIVGRILIADPDEDEVTCALSTESNRFFELQENEQGGFDILVRDGVALDYENDAHRMVSLTVSDGTHPLRLNYALALADQIDVLTGTARKDTLRGTSAAEMIKGLKGDDTLIGNGGDDMLYGGAGRDILAGGAGSDAFVFDAKPSARTNRDKIKDFASKDDAIWLDNKVFTKLGKAGSAEAPAQLKKTFFAITKAKDKNDYIVYNKKTGVLFYDADGSGQKAAVEIAQLKSGTSVSYKDLFVI